MCEGREKLDVWVFSQLCEADRARGFPSNRFLRNRRNCGSKVNFRDF